MSPRFPTWGPSTLVSACHVGLLSQAVVADVITNSDESSPVSRSSVRWHQALTSCLCGYRLDHHSMLHLANAGRHLTTMLLQPPSFKAQQTTGPGVSTAWLHCSRVPG